MNNSGFNWRALLFNSVYYAGKGKFTKGLIFSLFAWLPLFAIPIGVYCGLKANNELTQSQFDWKKAIIVAVVQFSIAIVFFK